MIGAIIADIFADAYIVAATFVAFALIGAMLFLVRAIRQYVGETKQHVELMKELVLMQKKLVEAQTNPFIYVDMGWNDGRSDKSELKIFIKNVGRSHALDINFINVKDDFALSTLGKKARCATQGDVVCGSRPEGVSPRARDSARACNG